LSGLRELGDPRPEVAASASSSAPARRTYISMMFVAGAKLPYVMAQVGHDELQGQACDLRRVLKR
jgi:hypothetical protein